MVLSKRQEKLGAFSFLFFVIYFLQFMPPKRAPQSKKYANVRKLETDFLWFTTLPVVCLEQWVHFQRYYGVC